MQLRNSTDFNRHPFKARNFQFENSKTLKTLVPFSKSNILINITGKFLKNYKYLCVRPPPDLKSNSGPGFSMSAALV